MDVEPRSLGDCPQDTQFYVCQLSGFRGCCQYDPCASIQGCSSPQGPRPTDASSTPATTSSVLIPWSMGSPAQLTSVPSTTGSSKPAPSNAGTPSRHVPIIIGTVVAAVAAIAILSSFVILWRRKRRRLPDFVFVKPTSIPKIEPLSLSAPSELEGSMEPLVALPAASQRRSAVFCPDGACPALSHRGTLDANTYHDKYVNSWASI